MKVKYKIIFGAGMCALLMMIATSIIFYSLIINYIKEEEIGNIYKNYNSTISMIQKEMGSIQNTVLDWAIWDDTYNFIQNKNEQFLKENLQDSSFKALKLNYIAFVDDDGKIIYSKGYNTNSNMDVDFRKENLLKIFYSKKFQEMNSAENALTGFMAIDGEPAMVSIAPVYASDGEAKSNGYLIMARYIDDTFIDYLEEVLLVNVEIGVVTKTNHFDNIKEYKQTIQLNNYKVWIKEQNDTIQSLNYVNDVFMKPDLYIKMDFFREAYRNGISAVKLFGIIYFISLLVIIASYVLVFEIHITKRLEGLCTFVEGVGNRKDTTARINISGKDEIAKLSGGINKMLEEIDGFYTEAKLHDERFRLIMEATNDGYFDANVPDNKLYISPTWLKYVGYEGTDGNIEYNQYLETIYSDDRHEFEEALEKCLIGESQQLNIEYRIRNKYGKWLWIAVRAKIVEYDKDGKPFRLIGSIYDITARKKYEEENRYLSQTDVVTGLKNRAHIEEVLKNISKSEECNPWIIMGDVNGLKLTNDTFGHHEGDRLLKKIGVILKKCCSAEDIPARWGGDEFIIIIRKNTSKYVEMLIKNIEKECEDVSEFPVKISIALGSAQRKSINQDMDEVLKVAEERMYRNKLLESRSARNSILLSLEQTLHEKHIETEEHTKRIKQLCLIFGREISLSQEELDELALLGVLHDIGKIAIPEAVLLKPGSLNAEEWEVMQTHTEIGYRIAKSTQELAHIADYILYHHEKFDGTGYPHGLHGINIPKLSRILTIVDSFDVMTHDRVYKKAMSVEDAVKELRKCAGRHFDPELVEAFIKLLETNNVEI